VGAGIDDLVFLLFLEEFNKKTFNFPFAFADIALLNAYDSTDPDAKVRKQKYQLLMAYKKIH